MFLKDIFIHNNHVETMTRIDMFLSKITNSPSLKALITSYKEIGTKPKPLNFHYLIQNVYTSTLALQDSTIDCYF